MTMLGKCRYLVLFGVLSIMAGQAIADPLPTEFLKFYQMPLNNGLTPYLPGVKTNPPLPAAIGYGSVPSTAIFPGHDELSTATATAYVPDPILGPVAVAWQGTFMADDFADYAGTPISHVRWWGSYLNTPATQGGVKKFLISFEHNTPAVTLDDGTVIPSHPDPLHPGNLHQIVDVMTPTPAPEPPDPGHFTEKIIPTGAGPPSPDGPLFEYNAELHLDKWFHEQAASARNPDDVYWLKIVALVDPQRDGQLQWGWHNRDWSIPDALAARKPDTPDGAEDIVGTVPAGGALQPVWHFEDDAVMGNIIVSPGMSPIMPLVEQFNLHETNYMPPDDGPSQIIFFSKDLAFELYTNIPEPVTFVLAGLGGLAMLGFRRRRRS